MLTPRAVAGLSQIPALLEERMGWSFAGNRMADLQRGLEQTASALGMADADELVDQILCGQWSSRITEAISSHLTIGETYFWREPRSLEAFRTIAIPPLLASREPNSAFRIWSAGCASGEEAYSLAMLLHDALPPAMRGSAQVLGTDINPHSLERARAASYRKWSFRDTPAWILDKYFETQPDHGQGEIRRVVPETRKMVKFSELNLATHPYPGNFGAKETMDAIFCRNVLIYFSNEQIQATINGFAASLKLGGYLVVSPSELSRVTHPDMVRVSVADATLFRKETPGLSSSVRVAGVAAPWQAGRQLGASRSPAKTRDKGPKPDEFSWQRFSPSGTAPTIPEPPAAPQGPAAASTGLFEPMKAAADAGELDRALDLADNALKADKTNAEMHYFRATLLHELNRTEEAMAALRNVLFLDENFVLAHFLRANLARQSGRAAEARKHWERSAQLLQNIDDDSTVPHSEGLSARRLRVMVAQALKSNP